MKRSHGISYHIRDISEQLDTDDGIREEDIQAYIVLKSLPQCAIKLSMLEKEYEHNYVRTAMHHMQK